MRLSKPQTATRETKKQKLDSETFALHLPWLKEKNLWQILQHFSCSQGDNFRGCSCQSLSACNLLAFPFQLPLLASWERSSAILHVGSFQVASFSRFSSPARDQLAASVLKGKSTFSASSGCHRPHFRLPLLLSFQLHLVGRQVDMWIAFCVFTLWLSLLVSCILHGCVRQKTNEAFIAGLNAGRTRYDILAGGKFTGLWLEIEN